MIDMNLPRPEKISDCVLVTHAGCMDGSGCAIMFLRAGGLKENIKYAAAGMVERFLKNNLEQLGDKFIIFADIGLSQDRDSYIEMLTKRGNCVLLDHHKTCLHMTGLPWCRVDMNFCGTELLRQYLGLEDKSSKALATLIQDHDLWLRKDPNSEALATFSVFAGQDELVERFVNRDVSLGVFTELESQMMKIVASRRDKIIDALLKKVIVKQLNWGNNNSVKMGYIISSEMNSSLLLDRALEADKTLQVACQLNLERGSASLRSRSGYDVSELAKYFGGGGHAAASGHRISESIIKGIVEEIHA